MIIFCGVNDMDYELVLTVKNGLLFNVMRKSGYQTAAELSRACGVSSVYIGYALNLKEAPYLKDGFTPRIYIKKMAEFLGVSIEEIYPRENLYTPLVENEFIAQVSKNQLEQLSGYSSTDPQRLLEIFETESRDSFSDILDNSGITEEESLVLSYRFKDKLTLKKTGEKIGVTGVRVMQIQKKALRKMRHPARKNRILESAGIYAEEFENGSH